MNQINVVKAKPYVPSEEEVKLKAILQGYHPKMWSRVVQKIGLEAIVDNVPGFGYDSETPISLYRRAMNWNGIQQPGDITYSKGEMGALLGSNGSNRSMFDFDGTLNQAYSAIAFADDVASHELTHGAHDVTTIIFNLPYHLGETDVIQCTEGIAELNGLSIMTELDQESQDSRERLVARYLGERIGMAYVIAQTNKREVFVDEEYYDGEINVTSVNQVSRNVNDYQFPFSLSDQAIEQIQETINYIIDHAEQIMQNEDYANYVKQHVPHFIGTVKTLYALQRGMALSDMIFEPFTNSESIEQYCDRLVSSRPELNIVYPDQIKFELSKGTVCFDRTDDQAFPDFYWSVAEVKVTAELYDGEEISFNFGLKKERGTDEVTDFFFQVTPEDRDRYAGIIQEKINVYGARQVAETQYKMLQRFAPQMYDLLRNNIQEGISQFSESELVDIQKSPIEGETKFGMQSIGISEPQALYVN